MILIQFFIAFFLWTFMSYWLHRFAHINHSCNPLYKIHKFHHQKKYDENDLWKFYWPSIWFWFGNIKQTLEIWIVFTIPAILIAIIIGGGAFYLLPLHYIYEVLFADRLVEHNPRIKGKITKIFAIGSYHLIHHDKFKYNYGFYITLWDHIFGTVKK